MSRSIVAIIGAGPYGLSLAAHLSARKVEHRIFGHPMLFWSRIADAGGERYLKSFCFGANISSPTRESTFADYSIPRGLETFEPCSIRDFAAYGLWFQKKHVAWVESVEAERVSKVSNGFEIILSNGECVFATHVVVATGLSYFDVVPPVLDSLPANLVSHTSKITAFAPFKGQNVAVIGAGQSALEAAALLHEAGAYPQLLVRESVLRWHTHSPRKRSLRQRLRSPISGLGGGRKAWVLTHLPGLTYHLPTAWRIRFLKSYLPPEGAWWLRNRVENVVPIHLSTNVADARCDAPGHASLRLLVDGSERWSTVDHVVAGSGYDIDVERLGFLDAQLRSSLAREAGGPKLNSKFEASVAGLHFIGPLSQMSFGPLFRFVVGAGYTARTVAAHLALYARSRT